jgi:DNA-binding transcriptional MerR regulator
MATATAKSKRTRIFYTVQEITRKPWSEPVGGNRVWSLEQAKRIRTILRKQRRECFLAQIRLYV